jgi:hypothetical protein
MRTQIAGTEVAQLEVSASQCRGRASEIRKLALTVVSEDMRNDFLQMSREWKALAERADGK